MYSMQDLKEFWRVWHNTRGYQEFILLQNTCVYWMTVYITTLEIQCVKACAEKKRPCASIVSIVVAREMNARSLSAINIRILNHLSHRGRDVRVSILSRFPLFCFSFLPVFFTILDVFVFSCTSFLFYCSSSVLTHMPVTDSCIAKLNQ